MAEFWQQLRLFYGRNSHPTRIRLARGVLTSGESGSKKVMIMGIPSHILEGNEEADKYFDELQNGTTPEPATEDESQLDESIGSDDEPEQFEQEQEQAPDEPAPAATKPADDGIDWQQRAKVAEGRLAAQAAQAKQQLAEMQANIAKTVQAEIARVESERKVIAEVQAKRQATAQRLGQYLDGDGVDALSEYIATFQPSPAPQETQQQYAPDPQAIRQHYEQSVASAFPDFNDVINTPEFNQWKFGTDPNSGRTRYELMLEANAHSAPAPMIAMMSQFMGERQATAQRNTATQQSALQKQVSPGRSRSGASAPTNTQQYLSPEQISKSYDRMNEHMRRGDYAAAQKLQKTIEASERHHGM